MDVSARFFGYAGLIGPTHASTIYLMIWLQPNYRPPLCECFMNKHPEHFRLSLAVLFPSCCNYTIKRNACSQRLYRTHFPDFLNKQLTGWVTEQFLVLFTWYYYFRFDLSIFQMLRLAGLKQGATCFAALRTAAPLKLLVSTSHCFQQLISAFLLCK